MLFAFVSERMNIDRVADWERPDAPPLKSVRFTCEPSDNRIARRRL